MKLTIDDIVAVLAILVAGCAWLWALLSLGDYIMRRRIRRLTERESAPKEPA